MVRKEMATSMRLLSQYQGLDIMRSPMSLYTSVTYGRASIQWWLYSGNTTCPATMLPLLSTDLVPNLTLHSLIAHWSTSAASCSPDAGSAGPSPARLVQQVASSDANPSTVLLELAAYLFDDDVDEFEKNALMGAGRAAKTVESVLRRKGEEISVEGVEATVRVLAVIVASDGIEDANKKRVATGLAVDVAASAASLAHVLRGRSGLEARIDAARLVEFLLANAAGKAKATVAESSEPVAELIRLIGPVDEKGSLDKKVMDTGLSYLAAISGSRRAARVDMVRIGAVPATVRTLHATTEPDALAKALRILESFVCCPNGRATLCEDTEEAVPAVVGKMMKAGHDGAKAAVAVLWAVCHKYRDRRAADATTSSEGGLTRLLLLLLLQGGCSLAARQMALELLKIYKVNAKSCLAGYDSKTTHIMPF